MMRKLAVCGVLGLLGACSSSDETSPEGQQQGINKGEESWQLSGDGGAPFDPTSPSCGSDQAPDPLNCEKFLVDRCMTKERIEHLPLDLCGYDTVGSTTILADAPECKFGTDQAWVVCCYGDNGPKIPDGGIDPTPQQDAGIEPTPGDASIYFPQPVDAGYPGQANCVDVGIGSAECSSQEEMAIKLAGMCKEHNMTLFPFVMDVTKDCAQGFGYHMTGSCCSFAK